MSDHSSLTAPPVKLPPYRPVETMDPYKPCWCGSDRKYKWCHQRRHEAAKINVFEIERRITAALQGGECSHPDPVADPCKGPVIKSHTIQRRGGLSQIAEDSHVLTVKPAMKGLMESEGESWPRPVGINKASVFFRASARSTTRRCSSPSRGRPCHWMQTMRSCWPIGRSRMSASQKTARSARPSFSAKWTAVIPS